MLRDNAGDLEVAAELAERARAGDGLDAADAGGDGASPTSLMRPISPVARGVRATAELGGEVADA